MKKTKYIGITMMAIGLAGLLSSLAFAQSRGTDVTVTAMPNLTFVPSEVTITEGDTVAWVGLDNITLHNVVSVDQADWNANQNAPNGDYSSGVAGASPTYMRTYTTAGESFYICTPHIGSAMKGKVIVQAPIPATGPWGVAALSALLLAGGSIVLIRRVR